MAQEGRDEKGKFTNVSISNIKPNPKNPRVIKDDK